MGLWSFGQQTIWTTRRLGDKHSLTTFSAIFHTRVLIGQSHKSKLDALTPGITTYILVYRLASLAVAKNHLTILG